MSERGHTFDNHTEIFPHAHPQTQSISLHLYQTHAHMYFTVHVMIYSWGGGSAFVQMCVFLNAFLQKDKNHWPVIQSAHRHWHVLHQVKESLFSTHLLVSASRFLLHLLPFHLSKAKETETEIRRGEVAPCVLLSPLCWKAEFHWKMFGIVFRWIKLPQPGRVWCDIFGRAAVNNVTRRYIHRNIHKGLSYNRL